MLEITNMYATMLQIMYHHKDTKEGSNYNDPKL